MDRWNLRSLGHACVSTVLAATLALGCSGGPARHADADSLNRSPISEEVPVRVLRARYEFRFDERANWSEVFTQEYRVLNRQGIDSWGGTGASWSPWYMARPVVEASVKDPDGKVFALDPKTLAESAEYPDLPDVYSDSRVLRGPLPGIRVGSVVTETIRNKTTRPFFAGGSAFQIAFQSDVPRDSVELVIDAPESVPLNYEILDAKVRQSETKQAGRRRVVFQGGPYPAVEAIDYYAPPTLPAWPSVGFSMAKSWQEIASAYADVVQRQLVAADLSELARRAVDDDDSPVEKANKVLTVLRERVRYAAVEFGQAAIIPAKPAETLKRAYGDCKDQALVLTGMLRSVGLPATLALLRTGPGQDVRPRLPALDVFNHAIVVIPGKNPIWIDPTVRYARAGELPTSDQGRLALIADSSTTDLVSTPIGTPKENTYLEVREVHLAEYGPARVREVSSATGIPEQRMRSMFTDSKENLTKSLSGYVKSTYFADKVGTWKPGDPERLSTPFQLDLDVPEAKMGFTELTSATSLVDYKVLESWLPDVLYEEEPRKYDLVLPFVYRAEIRYRIVPPKHFLVHKLPVVNDLELGPMKLARNYQKSADGSVEARFVLSTEKRQLNPADVEAFRKARKLLGAEAEEIVEFEHEGQQAVEARQSVRGIEIFRKLSLADPKSSTALLRWAVNLADVGFGLAARDKARSAVALAPQSAVAHRTLGIILERDEFGRQLHPGYDRDGARAAYRRAVELDATDTFSKVQAALLLEYDARGRRYANPEDLNRAVAEFDAIPATELDEYENGDFKHNGMFALFYAQRFEELRRRISERKPADTPGMLAVGAAAALSGVVAAVAEADRLGLRGEERSEAFAGAAASLYVLARYPEAAGLFDLAAGDSKQAAAYTNRARLLQGVSPVVPAKLAENTPEALVKKSQIMAAAAETREEATLAPLLAKRAPKELLRWSWYSKTTLENEIAVPRRVLADMAASMMKTSSEGNDGVGYRVRVTLSAPGTRTTTFDYFVVREGTRYGIRAIDAREVGCEALHLAGEKKDKAARQWLGWAKDMSTSAAGDDPLRSPPFLRLWSNGSGPLESSAAALCAGGSGNEKALEVLTKAVGTTGIDATAVDHALVQAATRADAHERALEAEMRLEKAHPDSKTLRSLKLATLWSLKRYADYEKVLRKALDEDKTPGADRNDLLSMLAHAAEHRGRLVEARRHYQTIIDERHATSSAYNSAAWSGLFVDPKPPDILNHALQAAQMSSFKSFSDLHTLAAVYVEMGKIEEARQTLTQLLELSNREPPYASTWYVVGAVAEAYGLPETARAAYQRLEPPKEAGTLSSYLLAKKRLDRLDGKSKISR